MRYQDPGVEEADPEDFRDLIYQAPTSERVRWWQATLDTSFDNVHGEQSKTTGAKWTRVEQNVRQYRVMLGGLKELQRYGQAGSFQTGDISLTFMPDELDISMHDWICPIGLYDYGTIDPDARTFQCKDDMLVRGNVQLAQAAGTLASSGATVTGTGTNFTSVYSSGSVLMAGKQKFRVVSVASDTLLTLESAPVSPWNGQNHYPCVERLRWDTAVVVDYMTDGTTVYNYLVDFTLGADSQTIQWNTFAKSPVVGAKLVTIYRYFPKYIILPDLGTHRKVINGVRLPSTVAGRLVNPEQYKGQ